MASSSLEPEPPAGLTARGGLHREVYGFLPYWEIAGAVLDYRALSTIAYFGVGADGDGNLIKRSSDGKPSAGWAGWTSSRMTTIINEAHLHGVRVALTVERFSWTASGREETVALLSSPTARVRLARQIAAAVRDRGVDGVNLDFEPIPSDQTANYTMFVRRVRTELDAIAPGYELVFDATGWPGAYDITALTAAGAADAVFIMGYDYRTGGASMAGSVAPLAGPTYDITDTIDAYLDRTAASKILLGVPYYGRAWSTTSDGLNAATRPQGSRYGYSTTAVYTTATALAAENGRRYDTVEQGAWTAYQRQACGTCPTTWRELYFDDERSLGAKYDLVNRRGLRGSGIWALGYDGTRTELWTLLRTKFGDDATPPLAGIRNLPAISPEEGIRVGWAGRDDLTGIRSYDVQVSMDGGPWQSWLTGTTLTAATFLGRTGHGYAFRVRATDRNGNRAAWDHDQRWLRSRGLTVGGFGRVVVPSLSIRSGPTVSATRLGTLGTGDVVALLEGPRVADGYDWYRVIAPVREWRSLSAATLEDVWVAAGAPPTPFLRAAQAPNATSVSAPISGFSAAATGPLVGDTTAGEPARGFSPNGDGRLDRLRLAYRLDRSVESLKLRVYRASDRVLLGTRTLPGITPGAHKWLWDGMITAGRVPDGQILLQLRATVDGATYSAPAADMTQAGLDLSSLRILVDTTAPTRRSLELAPASFSPNGDGRLDVTVLRAEAGGGPVRWTVDLTGPSGFVRRWSGPGGTVRVRWDGTDRNGRRVADGSYALRLGVLDALGNRLRASSTVTVDTRAPTGTLSVAPTDRSTGGTPNAFSPDGDGLADRVRLSWALSERAAATVRIFDGARLVHQARRPRASDGVVSWDGVDLNGRPARSARYHVVVTAFDPAGNRRILTGWVVLTRTAGFLQTIPWIWYPNDGDALATSGRFRFRLTATATVRLEILHRTGRVARTVWTGRQLPSGWHSWTWKGRLAAGTLAPEGPYQVRLTATRGDVTQVLTRGLRLGAFSIALARGELRAGTTVRVISRSAEPLAGAPVFSLAQPGVAVQRRIGSQRLDGRWQAMFTIGSSAGPAMISIRGTDVTGGINRSSRTVPVIPAAGS